LWSGEVETPEIQCEYQYVLELRNRTEHTCKLAKEMIELSHEKNKNLCDKKAKMRLLKPGTEILILRPDVGNKLKMKWRGPFKLLERKGEVNYVIEMENGLRKVCYLNMLKESG
jgi:hypothetical protein